MKRDTVKMLLVDEGMNTGDPNASKIGGGQLARKRFFSKKELFDVTVLTSEQEIAHLWQETTTVIYRHDLKCYRPPRTLAPRNPQKVMFLFQDLLRASKVLSSEIRNSHYDIIFINENKSRLLFIFCILFCEFKFQKIDTCIVIDGEWKYGIFDFFMKIAFLVIFKKIICPTKVIAYQLGLVGKLFQKKMLVAHPGVNISKFIKKKDKKNNLNRFGEKVIFGCIGTIRFDIKGQDIVVKAIERLLLNKISIPPFEVKFYGDGPDHLKLERMIRNKSLGKYFKICGYESDQEKMYNDIGACIIASNTEVAPLVLMECIVRDIPVIASNLPGIREIMEKFYSGMTFNAGSHEDLASLLMIAFRENSIFEIHKKLKKADKRIITTDYQAKRVYSFLSNKN